MDPIKLRGGYTAIITPFKNDESIDESSLENLIDFNIEQGISGIVPCGTTGESPTLSPEEHQRVIDLTIQAVNGRVPVLAGTGSNCTKEAIKYSQHAEKAGASAVLLVNPYYNKPTQEGLYRHFKAIAENVGIPCIVYNIQGRSAVNVETPTLMRLANDCRNITAVKEASGNLEQMKDVIAQRPEGFYVLSGDDNMALPLIKEGGDGVISVASNLIPGSMSEMVQCALNGYVKEAETVNEGIKKLFKMEFIETNPIPIKYMLSLQGMCEEVYRLPMCELSKEHKQEVKTFMEDSGLL
ncbi:4-hydroxy-tetrahydrodipicolinate synthase [Nanoarchaeota archaeon]